VPNEGSARQSTAAAPVKLASSRFVFFFLCCCCCCWVCGDKLSFDCYPFVLFVFFFVVVDCSIFSLVIKQGRLVRWFADCLRRLAEAR
jgi:hypothetical protein